MSCTFECRGSTAPNWVYTCALAGTYECVFVNPPNVVYACALLDEFLLIDWPRPFADPVVADANNTVVWKDSTGMGQAL
jgi:hypothetical protein